MRVNDRIRAVGGKSLCLFLAIQFAAAAGAQSVIVDNGDAGFSILSGTWSTGTYSPPWGADYRWVTTTGYDPGTPSAEVEWRPNLPQAGVYHVYVWYVPGTNRADNAPFTVHHAQGATPIAVNQQINGGLWFELGAFSFDAGTGGYVTLNNDAHANVIIADAVQFTRETATVELTMEAQPSGYGATAPAVGGPYTYGWNEIIGISAQPDTGYEFLYWAVSAGETPADPYAAATTVRLDQSKTVIAVFAEETPMPAEFRGFWADAFHEGYKSTTQINAMIARAVAGGYNAIVPEVMAYQDTGASGHGAYWNSAILPRAADISGGIDPLAYLVQQAHANGLEVHPWLVTYRICASWPPAGNPLLSNHPEWTMVPSGSMGSGPTPVSSYYVLDPGSPDAQEYLISIVREIVSNYAVDGIHWDYIRYTTTDAGYPAYTWYNRSGLARYQQISGQSGVPEIDDADWCDFRRTEITELIRRAEAVIATADNPRQPLRQTAALVTWGNAPSAFENTNSYRLFQNWREWLAEGYLDAGVPMAYYDWDVYPSYYMNWVNRAVGWRSDRHIYIGPGIYLNSFENSAIEIEYARSAGANGLCTYAYYTTSGSRANWDWYPYVGGTAFAEPAVVPPMPWRDPATTVQGNIFGRVTDGATGAPLDDATVTINGFAAAQTDGNGFYNLSKLSADAGGTPLWISAVRSDYAEVARPAVLLERAGYTEANFGLGSWLFGDYDADADVDAADLARFLSTFTGPNQGPPPAGGDLFDREPDNDVDLLDFAEFQAAYTG